MTRARKGRVGAEVGLSSALALAALVGCAADRTVTASSTLPGGPSATGEVLAVGYTVRELERVAAFFVDLLDASRVDLDPVERAREERARAEAAGASTARIERLRIGGALVELTEYAPDGRPFPEGSRSNDRWFQHIAVVVSDIDAAHARVVESGAASISAGGPQTLPESIPEAAGIRAFYFRDPEGHPLELIQYPAGKGQPRWHDAEPLVLGVDHTAIAVADGDASARFYEASVGLTVAGESFNHGAEQAALTGVPGARVHITGLRGVARAGGEGPGVELLDYEAPADGRPFPADTTPRDAWHWEITLRARDLAPGLVRDPDGHALRVVP